MKTILTLTLAGSLAVLTHDLAPRQEAGQVRTLTFELESSSELVDMQMLMNGEEGPGMPEMEQLQSDATSGTFIDRLLAVDGGRATRFERTYEDLAGFQGFEMNSDMMGSMSEESDLASDLDGLTVVFERDDEGAFEAAWPEDAPGDDDLLVGLEAALPFAEFLAPEGVEVDDSWELDPELVSRLLDPGGSLSLRGEDGPEGLLRIDDSAEDIDVERDGELTATLERVVDGQAVVSLAFEYSEVVDLTEHMAAMQADAPEDAPEGMMMPDIQEMTNAADYEGEGTLVWDLDAGHLVELSLEYEVEEVQSMVMSMDMGGDSMEMEQISTTLGEGTARFVLEVERE